MNLEKWTPYLPPRARLMLEALRISARAEHESALPFAEACLLAQADADKGSVPIVVGWQINDVSGNKEPGWCVVGSLPLLTIEPVALLYPIERNVLPCRPRK